MDWRKRLDELEKQVQQATDRGEFVGVRDRLAWDITMDHVPKLIEGYRLLAEAVEQLENSLYLRGDDEYVCPDPECRRPPKEGHDAYCKLGPALALLRGVGRD